MFLSSEVFVIVVLELGGKDWVLTEVVFELIGKVCVQF